MSSSEHESRESKFEDEYEEVVLEEPDKGSKKRSKRRVLWRITKIFLVVALIFFCALFFYLRKAMRDGGYSVSWDEKTDGLVLKNERYGDEPWRVMDVYVPKKLDPAKKHGAILFIHGGAWIGGDRREQEGFAKAIAKEGYLAANMEYRLYCDEPRGRKEGYSIDDVLEDVRLALTKLLEIGAQQGYKIDRVALSGHSAGGHISMLYGFRSRTQDGFETPVEIAFVAPRVGPVDFHAKTWEAEKNPRAMAWFASFMSGVPITPQQFVNPDEKTEAALQSISPLYDVKPGVLPTLAAYGANDSLVPAPHCKLLKHAFSKLKAKSIGEIEFGDTETQVFDLLVFPNSNHMLARDPDFTLKWRGLFLAYASRYLATPGDELEKIMIEETGGDLETIREEIEAATE